MILWQPVLEDGRDLGVLVPGYNKDIAIKKSINWLKQQEERVKFYFAGTWKPIITDAVPVSRNIDNKNDIILV